MHEKYCNLDNKVSVIYVVKLSLIGWYSSILWHSYYLCGYRTAVIIDNVRYISPV